MATKKTALTLGFLFINSTHQFLVWQAGTGFSTAYPGMVLLVYFRVLRISSYF